MYSTFPDFVGELEENNEKSQPH